MKTPERCARRTFEAQQNFSQSPRPYPRLPHQLKHKKRHTICPCIIALFAAATTCARNKMNWKIVLVKKHSSVLLQLSLHPHVTHSTIAQALYQTYLEILQYRRWQFAPLANCSIDRRCLRQFRENICRYDVGAAICFVCARRYPFVPNCRNSLITWVPAYDARQHVVLGQTPARLEQILGWKTFQERYIAPLAETTQKVLRAQMDPWKCELLCPRYALTLVVCPEDKRCERVRPCGSNRMRADCEAPICTTCFRNLYREQRKPPEALSNKLLGHPPRELYAHECTVLELLCASPCMTALTCYSLEWRYLHDRSLAHDAFMNRRRLCAKGNATTFPLQWEDLLSELQELEKATNPAAPCLLPHLGVELRDRVAVLIKMGKGPEDSDAKQRIIHQAVVRRRVVVALIAAMVAREHPAYRSVNMAAVTERAAALPENDVPEEVIALLENDENLTHVHRQKAATAVNTEMSEEQISREFARMLKPNAVVLEKTCAGFQDVNSQQVTRLQNIVQETQTKPVLPEVVLYTGTKLLDQFQPTYFALAFPFVFPFGLGLPDPPQWSQQQIQRCNDEPLVALSTWVRAMARRVEAQVSRDWVFGFTSWNLLFRSSLNLSRTTDAYSRAFYDEDEHTWVQPTGTHIEAAAKQLLAALQATYVDVSGQPRAVKGDVTKLPDRRGSEAAFGFESRPPQTFPGSGFRW